MKNQNDIELIFKKLKIKNLIFTKLNTLPLDINAKITAEVEKTTNIQENINVTEELYKQLKDDNTGKTINFDVIDKRGEYLEKFRKAKKMYMEELDKAEDKELKRALYFSFRDYQEKLVDQMNKELIKILT